MDFKMVDADLADPEAAAFRVCTDVPHFGLALVPRPSRGRLD